MSDGFASRFDQDIVHLLRDKESKSMNTSKKLAIDLQKQFYAAKGRAFKKQSLKKSKLDGLPKSITGELLTLLQISGPQNSLSIVWNSYFYFITILWHFTRLGNFF